MFTPRSDPSPPQFITPLTNLRLFLPPYRKVKMKPIQRLRAALFLPLALAPLITPGASAAPTTPNQNFVHQLYLDLLTLPPSAAELAISTQLDNATLTRSQLVSALTSSDEFLSDQVIHFHPLLLHRLPTP